jgi:hypothetical protein
LVFDEDTPALASARKMTSTFPAGFVVAAKPGSTLGRRT